jgi:Predicted membrane protein/domain
VLCLIVSSFTGVRASAAQKLPVNKICPQCGAVLTKGALSCNFCDSSESVPIGDHSKTTQGNQASNAIAEHEWRGELNQRLQAYRAKRRKLAPNEAQSELPFNGSVSDSGGTVAVQLEEAPRDTHDAKDDFAFTIAIGRIAGRQDPNDARLLIDVSVSPEEQAAPQEVTREPVVLPQSSGIFPVASLDERRSAALIDAACLAFAYGGFLALFGSLGGHFTFSKLSAAVCFSTFAFVYLQYFGLFTIFGGTTPGMMIRGLQVATFAGELPTLRHLLLRATGYMLSVGTLFLGFLWALWDEDSLTWHDRLSGTYLTAPDILTDLDAPHTAATH